MRLSLPANFASEVFSVAKQGCGGLLRARVPKKRSMCETKHG
jgi:hypothetical protein